MLDFSMWESEVKVTFKCTSDHCVHLTERKHALIKCPPLTTNTKTDLKMPLNEGLQLF